MSIEKTSPLPAFESFIPRQRAPFGETLRRILLPVRVRPAIAESDIDMLCANLCEVAVWTSSSGSWQENASFLLTTADQSRHLVAFGDPMAGALIARVCRLPRFDADRLLDLIGSRTEEITVLWRRPALVPERV